MKYRFIDIAVDKYETRDLYAAHVIVNRYGALEKNQTKWTNEELQKITNDFTELENINKVGSDKRLLLTKNIK